jgi:hypothetical protein
VDWEQLEFELETILDGVPSSEMPALADRLKRISARVESVLLSRRDAKCLTRPRSPQECRQCRHCSWSLHGAV